MPDYRFTGYFGREVLRKRSYLRRELCIAVVEHPIRFERMDLRGRRPRFLFGSFAAAPRALARRKDYEKDDACDSPAQ